MRFGCHEMGCMHEHIWEDNQPAKPIIMSSKTCIHLQITIPFKLNITLNAILPPNWIISNSKCEDPGLALSRTSTNLYFASNDYIISDHYTLQENGGINDLSTMTAPTIMTSK